MTRNNLTADLGMTTIHACMTLRDIAEAIIYSDRFELDTEVEVLLRENDADAGLQRSHDSKLVAELKAGCEKTLGKRSDFYIHAKQLGFPQKSLEPRSFAKTLMISMMCLHVRRREACGLDVISLMIDMCNRQLLPELLQLSAMDDPRHALRYVGWCLAGEVRVLGPLHVQEEWRTLTECNLLPLAPELVAASGIFRDEALILACGAQTLLLISELAAAQKKLVRLSALSAKGPEHKRRAPRKMSEERADLKRSLELGVVTQLMSDLETGFEKAKTALTIYTQLQPHARDFPLNFDWRFEIVLLDLAAAVLGSAKRSVEHIPVLAEKYNNARRRYETGPYAIERIEEIATVNAMAVGGEQTSVQFLRNVLKTRSTKTLELYFILKKLENVAQHWRILLAAESIVLAEFLEAGPWRSQDEYSPFLNWIDQFSPSENRLTRPPDLEIRYLGEQFFQLLDSGELPSL